MLNLRILLFLALILGFSGQAMATAIISGDGDETCVNGAPLGAGACSVQTISVHSLWQPNDPNGNGATWVSYADTGPGGSTLAPTSSDPVFTVIESFYAAAGDVLTLDVWADDTAEVFINGALVSPPANFTQDICADGAIGCEPDENAMISYLFDTGGAQHLSIDVYQVGTGTNPADNPFGVLYSGDLKSVPEPFTLGLLATGLLGVGITRRRRTAQEART